MSTVGRGRSLGLRALVAGVPPSVATLAAVAILAMLSAVAPAAVRAADPTYTGFVISSEPGAALAGGLLHDQDPSTPDAYYGARLDTGNAVASVYGGGWTLHFEPGATAFSVGDYGPGGAASLKIRKDGDSCLLTNWTVRILEEPLWTGTRLTRFSADFVTLCGEWSPVIRGSVRIGSAYPTRLLHMAPSVTLEPTIVGAASADRVVSVLNAGGEPVALTAGVKGGANPGDFAIHDGCGTTSLAPGQSCDLRVSFNPTATTGRSATWTFGNDTFDPSRTLTASAFGLSPITQLPSALVVHSSGPVPPAGDHTLNPADWTTRHSTPARVELSADVWTLHFADAAGQPLEAGTYPDVPEAQLALTYNGTSCGLTEPVSSFTVLDPPVFDADGTLLQFAADFTWYCPSFEVGRMRGWVRLHSERPVPVPAAPAYTLEITPTTARAGDTVTITPKPVGVDVFAAKRCTMTIQNYQFSSALSRMSVASDDCAPWTFTLPKSTAGGYWVAGSLSWGEWSYTRDHEIATRYYDFEVAAGGSAGAFSTNYPVQSWDPDAVLSDPTPTYGEPQTIHGPTGADGCWLEMAGGYEGIWTRQNAGCDPWTVSLAAPPSSGDDPFFLPWADVRVVAWTGTSAWDAAAPESPMRGARSGETYIASTPVFTGTGGSYASSLPAIFTGEARNEVRYIDVPGPYTYTPVVLGAIEGSCVAGDPPVASPVSGGECAAYSVPDWAFDNNGTWSIRLELRDVAGEAIAGAGTDLGFVKHMAAVAIDAPVTAQVGTEVAIGVSTPAGAPATYDVRIDPAAAGAPDIHLRGAFAVDLAKSGDTVALRQAGLPGGSYTLTATLTDVLGSKVSSSRSLAVLDTAGPAGTVRIAGGADFARSNTVTMDVPATDPSGVTHVRLSNDGSTWVTRAYASTQPWTLTTGSGTRTVWVGWRDALGNWSAAKTDTIVLDTVAPVAVAPQTRLGTGTMTSGRASVGVRWSGSDAISGIARYELAMATDGRSWVSLGADFTAGSSVRSLAPGHTYAFRVRAVDRAGNRGSWAPGTSVRLSGIQQSARAVAYTGRWATSTASSWWGGSSRHASAAGATARFRATVRSVAWVAATGPNRGKAKVYVNGAYVATVNLYASTPTVPRIVWSRTFASSATRAITIRVLGTAGRPRVDLDGFLVLR